MRYFKRMGFLGLVTLLVSITQVAESQVTDENKYLSSVSTKNIKVIKEGTEFVKVFPLIEEEYNVNFFYKTHLLSDKVISERRLLDFNNSVYTVIEQLLSGSQFKFDKLTHRTIGISVKKQFPFIQEVSGSVRDAQSGEPLPGVNILVKGTSTGTSTNSDGDFELVVSSLQDTLVFSFIGYQTKEVPIDGRNTINVALGRKTVTGEEVVVVGYGEQQRGNITGSVKQIGGESLEAQPTTSASAALMGQAAGVTVQQNSGQPGRNEGNIQIRGIGTLSNADPLVLIDGVEGNLNDIPSSDIEDISILKDAASAAIYGSRAANGVILVTTKRGESGDIQANYRSSYSWNSPTRQPEYVDAGRFMRLENEAATNLGKSPIWSEQYIQEWEQNHETDPNNYPNTDWVGEVFSGSGFQQSQALSLSGGTENIRVLGSFNYDQEQGTILNHAFKRYSIRLNSDITLSDQFDLNIDLNTIRNDRERSSLSHDLIIRQAYRIPPIYAGLWEGGGYGPGWDGRNPIAFAEEGGTRNDEDIIIKGRINFTYKPIENLEFDLMYAPDYESVFYKRMRKTIDFYDPETGDELQLPQAPQTSDLLESWGRNFTHNLNFRTNYELDLGVHNFEILGGYELIEYQRDIFDAYRDDFTLEGYEELDAGSSANQQNSGNSTSYNLQSFFSRVTYNYDSRYLFEANLRYDGSSRFAQNTRWGLFPSFSGGWNISEEDFLQDQDYISNLKLRASWGKLGNQDIAGNFPYAAFINLNQEYIFGGEAVPAAAQLSLANESLTWEETTTLNLGTDVSLFENRVDFSFDWFKRTTDDILLTLPIPSIIGLNPPYQNAGVVENIGWEVEAGYNGSIGSEFNFGISFNISDVENEVVDLKDTGPYISGTSITKEGYPINSIYGYETDGLFDSQQEIDNHATQTGQIAPGDIKYVDQLTVDTDDDGVPDETDGIINADDRTVIGDPFPRYNYGIDIDLSYKNFNISALFQGIGKRDVLLQQNVTWAFYNAGKIAKWQAADYWTQDNQNASYPRLTQTTSHNNFQASDYWMYDGSYLRLRNLQISYTLPTKLMDQIGIRDARIFATGQNLVTLFDNMPQGVDPNVPSSTTGSYFPVNRVISGGIEIDF